MKLEVGMYVRTDNGIIGRIYEKIGDMFTYKDNNRDYITYGVSYNEIIKASFNIIDLIEVGDIIKFRELRTYITNPSNTKYYEDYIYDVHNKKELGVIKQELKKKHIKLLEIVTKEQFEQMSYKLGE